MSSCEVRASILKAFEKLIPTSKYEMKDLLVYQFLAPSRVPLLAQFHNFFLSFHSLKGIEDKQPFLMKVRFLNLNIISSKNVKMLFCSVIKIT